MRVIHFVLLTIRISSEIINGGAGRAIPSASGKSFEKKLEESYQLLKNEKNANDTKNFLEELHNLEADKMGVVPKKPNENDNFLSGKDNNATMTIEEFNRRNKVDTALFQGDMLLTKEQAKEIIDDIKHNQDSRNKRQAYRAEKYPANTERRVFRKATAAWHEVTCLDFKEDENAKDRVGVYTSNGCFSRVGKVGGVQGLSLGGGCDTVGDATHELGHALGFLHTHMRHDRDSYITVNRRNIRHDWWPQFIKVSDKINDNYNLTYDYGSIMHYGAASQSRNGDNTMVPHDKNYLETLGSHMLSFYDILMMNLHYKCLDHCDKKRWEKCQNGGFPHPRNCYKCICPSGYGGKYCNERPSGCGKTFLARTTVQTFEDIIGTKYNGVTKNDDYKMCNYWIVALPGSTIEIKLDSYDSTVHDEGCREAGVEIKTGNDTRRTGYRFCSRASEGIKLNSTYNIVPVVTYSAVGNKNTVISYRIASTDPNFKCRDTFICKPFLKLKLCTASIYTDKMRRKICPKSCGFCL